MAEPRIRLAEVLAALSLASDLGTGTPLEHALRTCVLAIDLGEALGLDETELADVYHLALLRFAGCTADAHVAAATFFAIQHDLVLDPGDQDDLA